MGTKRITKRRAERRREARTDARLSMRVEGGPDDGELAQIVTESQNISASGVYCYAPHYLAPLSKVALTLVLPRLPGGSSQQELIKCEGIVVRCETVAAADPDRKYELACMFSDLDEERQRRLSEFVNLRNLQALRAAARGAAGKRSNAEGRRKRAGTGSKARSGTRARAAKPAASAARKRPRRTVH